MNGDHKFGLDAFEQRLLTRARQSLDEALDSIDDETALRLRQIRREVVAIAATSPDYSQSPTSFWQCSGGLVATAAMVMLTVSLLWSGAAQQWGLSVELDEMALMNEAHDIELYQELDFYLWLADETELG